MGSLPIPPGPELALLPMTAIVTALVLVFAALGVAALVAFSRWKPPRRRPAPPAPEPRRPRTPTPSDLDVRARKLAERHLLAGTIRLGFHELAEMLEEHLERVTGLPASRLTARELAARLEPAAAGDLLGRVRDARYAKASPRPEVLERTCQDAGRLFLTAERGWAKPARTGR